MSGMRYDGFISYSHAADGRLAPALQKALQKLAKPWFRRRSLEIFRDETGLSVDPHLWGAIVKALDNSEWFLLLTSPSAARSEWVNREIEHWKAHRPVDRILPVVTDGHWQWDDGAGDFTVDSDAVPPALRGVFADEPRHLDLRWAHAEDQVDLNNSRFRNAAAEIAAPLHGVTKDEIEGEDVRQHRRTVRVAWSAAASLAVLTVAAVVASFFAVDNANRAEQRRILAESQRLANYSQNEPAASDLAFLLAAQGYRLGANALTETALFRSVTDVPPEIKQRIATNGAAAAVAISDKADRVWVGTAEGDVVAYRFSDGVEVAHRDDIFKHAVVAMARIGDDAVVVTDGTTTVTLDDDLSPSSRFNAPSALSSLAVDPVSGWVAAGSLVGEVFVWAPGGAAPTMRIAGIPGVAAADFIGVTSLAWTPDKGLIVAGGDGALRRFDTPEAPTWEQPETVGSDGWLSAVAVLGDGTIVTGGTDGSVGFRSAATGLPTGADAGRRHTGGVRGVAATGDSPENGSVVVVGGDGYMDFFNHLTGERALLPVLVGDVATSVAWDPANPMLGVAGSQEGVTLLDYAREQLPAVAQAVTGWSEVSAVAMSPDGTRLAVSRRATQPGSDKAVSEVVLTDPANPDPNGPSIRIDSALMQLLVTPDGTVLAGTGDGDVVSWDGKAAEPTVVEVAPGAAVSQLAISPAGTTVAAGTTAMNSGTPADAPLRFWRFEKTGLVPARGSDLKTFGYGLSFTPDGKRVVVGGLNKFDIYPLDGGTTTTVELTNDSPRSLAVSPDGRTLAVGLWSGPIRFFDLQTGQPTGDELRQADMATAIAFRDDSSVLVTVGNDGGFKLWDLISLRSLTEDSLSTTDNTDAQASPKTPSLAMADDLAVTASFVDGRLLKWSLDPDEWIAAGCLQHPRELTESEKSRFDLENAAPVCPKD
jgi:WD40 repeat protein